MYINNAPKALVHIYHGLSQIRNKLADFHNICWFCITGSWKLNLDPIKAYKISFAAVLDLYESKHARRRFAINNEGVKRACFTQVPNYGTGKHHKNYQNLRIYFTPEKPCYLRCFAPFRLISRVSLRCRRSASRRRRSFWSSDFSFSGSFFCASVWAITRCAVCSYCCTWAIARCSCSADWRRSRSCSALSNAGTQRTVCLTGLYNRRHRMRWPRHFCTLSWNDSRSQVVWPKFWYVHTSSLVWPGFGPTEPCHQILSIDACVAGFFEKLEDCENVISFFLCCCDRPQVKIFAKFLLDRSKERNVEGCNTCEVWAGSPAPTIQFSLSNFNVL